MLIVEAVPQFIESLSSQLVGLGYRVVIARSGTEALEKARRLQPCIIFVNPVLPLLSGWDLLTLLKSNLETRQIPVIVTASKVDEAHSHRAVANGWLSMPIQLKALRQTLRQLVIDMEEPSTQNAVSTNVLTVLHLGSGGSSEQSPAISNADLTRLLHSHHYRVLEADDLEQAELLARVWKPNVVLLEGPFADSTVYFQQFSQHAFLASLPLVILDQEATQAANQVPGLLVFPCLASTTATSSTSDDRQNSALLQVIQIAAGHAWRPSILALDLATLPRSLDSENILSLSDETPGGIFSKEAEWLQALTQYLQTAGLRGLMGRSWQEVLQQVQSQSVDLLLICWTDSVAQSTVQQMLSDLRELENKPPILVLDHRHHEEASPQLTDSLPLILQEVATQILPSSLSMAELLDQIQYFLVRS